MDKSKIDYSKIDGNIRSLVRVLNDFESIFTFDSCGGHKESAHGLPEGQWNVFFHVDLYSIEGIEDLEFLAWAINWEYGHTQDHNVVLKPDASSGFGSMGMELHFLLEGKDTDPEQLAEFLKDTLDSL